MSSAVRWIAKALKGQSVLSLALGIFAVTLTPTVFFTTHFSLLERSGLGLAFFTFIGLIRGREGKQLVFPVLPLALILLIFVSILQSLLFSALKDAFAFLALILIASVTTQMSSRRTIINGFAVAGLLLSMWTLASMLWVPSESFEYVSKLHGPFFGRNSLALSLGFLTPAVLFQEWESPAWTRISRYLSLTLIGFEIILTTSKTSLVLFVLSILVWLILKLFTYSRKAGAVATGISVLSFGVLLSNWTFTLDLLGKSNDLSGRFPLWQVYVQAAGAKNWTGYGWSVRTTPDTELGMFINLKMGEAFINANNDALNWWAQTGLIGGILATACLLSILIYGIRVAIKSNEFTDWWVPIVGLILIIGGFTELSLGHPEGWFLASVCICVLGSQSPAQKKTLLNRFMFIDSQNQNRINKASLS